MKYQVLVVEHEPSLLRGIVGWLEGVPGLLPIGVSSLEEAEQVLDDDPPDLLLTDFRLSGHTGLDLVQQVERRELRIPIVVMTPQDSSHAAQLRHYDRLTLVEKPVPLPRLRQIVQEKLSLAHSARMPSGPFQLTDYLQLAGLGGHSLLLEVELDDGQQGRVEVVDGDLWNAYAGDTKGTEALRQLLDRPLHAMKYVERAEPPGERQFTGSMEGILLELARQSDEARHGEEMEEVDLEASLDSAFQPALEGVVEAAIGRNGAGGGHQAAADLDPTLASPEQSALGRIRARAGHGEGAAAAEHNGAEEPDPTAALARIRQRAAAAGSDSLGEAAATAPGGEDAPPSTGSFARLHRLASSAASGAASRQADDPPVRTEPAVAEEGTPGAPADDPGNDQGGETTTSPSHREAAGADPRPREADTAPAEVLAADLAGGPQVDAADPLAPMAPPLEAHLTTAASQACAEALAQTEGGRLCALYQAVGARLVGLSDPEAVARARRPEVVAMVALFAAEAKAAGERRRVQRAFFATASAHYFFQLLGDGQTLILVETERSLPRGVGWLALREAHATLSAQPVADALAGEATTLRNGTSISVPLAAGAGTGPAADACRLALRDLHGGRFCTLVDLRRPEVAATSLPYQRGAVVGSLFRAVLEPFAVNESPREAFLSTGDQLWFLARLEERQVLAILGADSVVPQGEGWLALRDALPRLADALPDG
jgi:CheY-like chemotaxis protein